MNMRVVFFFCGLLLSFPREAGERCKEVSVIVGTQAQHARLIRQLKKSHIQIAARCFSLHRFSSCEAKALPGLIRLGIKCWRWQHVGPKSNNTKGCPTWGLKKKLQDCWDSAIF